MAEHRIRVGIVGAGENTRVRHIPGFQQIPGVEIVGVVNSRPESTARVAADFGIPKTYAHWEELVADPQVDAVQIGTYPNLHSAITCAALNAGKHVLCEARMAASLHEAQQMLAAAEAHPNLVAQVVPSPLGLECGEYVGNLIRNRFLGELREVIVIGANDQFWDFSRILHWRQQRELSGVNVLMLGVLQETVSRWIGPTSRVFAQATVFEPSRPAPQGEVSVEITVPDSVQIVTQLANGCRAIYHVSGTILFGPPTQIHLYGSLGTIKVEFGTTEKVSLARANEKELRLIELPPEKKGGWRVEAEFIGAIRGEEPVRYCDFATGVQYMEFTEAVAISAESGRAVELPLTKLT